MKKTLFYLIISAFVIAIAMGIYIYNKPHKSIKNAEPELLISAQELHALFLENESDANEQFLGKIIVVEGTITTVNQSDSSSISLTFIDPVFGITCTFNSEQEETDIQQLFTLERGDFIEVKGRLDGFLTDVHLSKCYLYK